MPSTKLSDPDGFAARARRSTRAARNEGTNERIAPFVIQINYTTLTKGMDYAAARIYLPLWVCEL